MTRSLPALAAIAAVSVAGVWIHAATRGAAPEPTAVIETIEIVPASPARTHEAPADAPQPVTVQAGPRPVRVSRDAEPAVPATATSHGAAMRIARDPATGQIVAPEHSGPALTIDDMQELARREADGLVTIRNADGSETLNHEGRFADHTVVRIGPDGRPVFQCVHGPLVVHPPAVAPARSRMEDR